MGVYRFADWGLSHQGVINRLGPEVTIAAVSNVSTIDLEGPAWMVPEIMGGMNHLEYLGEVIDGVLVPPTPPEE